MGKLLEAFKEQVTKGRYKDEHGNPLTLNLQYQELVGEAKPKRQRGFEAVPAEHLKYARRRADVPLPVRGSKSSAGYDFVATVALRIAPGSKVFFWTDVCAYMQEGEVLLLDVRSSAGVKKGVALSNTIGVIDADYYHNDENGGNIGISLRNLSAEVVTFEAGERVAQGIFMPFLTADSGDTSDVRTGGFGSTGL